MFIYLTELIKGEVIDKHGRYVGKPFDFAVSLDESYPRVTALIIKRGIIKKSYFVINWKDLNYGPSGFQLKQPESMLESLPTYTMPDVAVLRKSVLDHQVVDTYNRKVVRVNDIHFLRVDSELRLAHVDFSARGLVRRLGWERVVDGIVRLVYRHSRYLTDEGLISWKYIQPLSIRSASGSIQLNVELNQLKSIPPPDLSSMLMELDPHQRTALIRTMDVQSQVDTITELDLKWQRDLIEELDTQTLVRLFERMPADEATDLLASLAKRDSERILSMLSPKKARSLLDLMQHESDSAGGLMTKEFMTLREDMTVAEAIDYIKKAELQKKSESIHTAFVVDIENKLTGSVPFRKLLFESTDRKVSEIMQRKPPSINVEGSLKDVAYGMDKYNLFILPVVSESNVLEGIITVDDVLHRVVEEAWGRKTGI